MPARAAVMAQQTPASPPPTTTRSDSSSIVLSGRRSTAGSICIGLSYVFQSVVTSPSNGGRSNVRTAQGSARFN